MKLTNALALLFATAAVLTVGLYLLTSTPIDKFAGLIVVTFAILAAFFVSPDTVSAWVKQLIDHLPGRSP
jgi:hypothetical protein